MVAVAARELAETPGGAEVVSSLIGRLLGAGGYCATEAAQVAWECRRVDTIRESVLGMLDAMYESEDLAVRQTAISLAKEWGITLGTREAPPARRLRVDAPHATSELIDSTTFRALRHVIRLVLGGSYTWTWPLKDALTLAARASGLPLRTSVLGSPG